MAGSGRSVRAHGRQRRMAWLMATTMLVPAMTLAPARAADTPDRDDDESGELRLAQRLGEPVDFDIPALPMAAALNAFGRQAGVQVTVDAAAIAGLSAPALSGRMTPDEALQRLLGRSGITWRFTGDGTVALERVSGESGAVVLDPITVEGRQARGRFGDLPAEPEGFKADYQSSATKTPQPLRETPQSVGVVTQDSLETRQVQDLGQALETVAGVHQYSGTGPFGGTSPFGFDEVQIRGVAIEGDLDIREDGFVSPTFFSRPDMAIYERIEAVKGPSSVLYGRGSAGGFINRVRKKPLAEAQLEGAAEIGSYDRYRAEGDVTGPLFASKRVRGRLIAAYQDEESFVDGVESARAVLAPSLELDVTDSTRVLLHGLYQNDQFIPNPGFPLQSEGGGRFRAPDISRSLFVGVPSRDKNEWEVLTGSLQIDQRVGDNWLGTLKISRTAQDSPIDIDSYAYGIAPNGNVYLYSSAFQFDTDVWSGELQLRGDLDLFGRPVTLIGGLDHVDQEQARTDAFAALGVANIYDANFADFPTVQPTALARSQVIENVSTGAYGQLIVEPVDRLRLLFGGRHDWADSTLVDRLGGTTSETQDRAFTWRAGASFDVVPNVAVYALYAESFSPDVFSVGRGGQILDPETGVTYEAGVKSEWLGGKLAVNAAVFRIERDDVPIPDPSNGPGEFFSISGGLQRSDGIELEINGEPLPGWTVSFGGILLDSEFIEADDPFFGSKPAGAADWQVGLYTSYELQSGPAKGLGLGVGLFAIDDRGISTFQAGGELDGYERVDFTAFYNGLDPIRMSLQLRNAFDETYVEGADRTGAYAQFGAPRTLLFTLRVRY